MNNGLQMKYFVLNPTKQDSYGEASREALLAYANAIKDTNPALSLDLDLWLYNIKNDLYLNSTDE